LCRSNSWVEREREKRKGERAQFVVDSHIPNRGLENKEGEKEKERDSVSAMEFLKAPGEKKKSNFI